MTKWEEQKDKLIDLIQVQKLPYEQIGRMFNCSGSNIKKVAKKLGIELIPKRKINETETFNKGKCKKSRKSICLNCGCEFTIYNSVNKGKYCSHKCQVEYDYKSYIQRWKNGEEDGLKGEYSISNHIKKYLFRKYNNSCQICGWNQVNKFTGNVPLEVHHIDGDYTNNKEENLQLLCPNCHSLTETFKNHNVKGRKGRKKYN